MRPTFSTIFATCVCGVAIAHAAAPAAPALKLPAGLSTAGPYSLDSQRRVDFGTIIFFASNYGYLAYDPSLGSAGLYYPKGTNKAVVFSAGLWLGATVSGPGGTEVRVATADQFGSEFGPGQIVQGAADDPTRPEYAVYKVVPWTGNPSDSAHVDRTPDELAATPGLDPFAHHSWSEYLNGAEPFGAPTRLYRLPDVTTPDPGDSVAVPGPMVVGDQMLWCVYNDADPALHANASGGTAPLGVEIQQFLYGLAGSPNDRIVSLVFRIMNKGPDFLHDLYAGLWMDADLGGYTDDLVGCDTSLALGYCYNSTNADAVYGASPPAVGGVAVYGPVNPSAGAFPRWHSFSKLASASGSSLETYNLLRGLLPSGDAIIDPTTGQPTRFFHSGDPVLGQGWLDSNPGDRICLLSAGPLQLPPNESQTVAWAMAVGQGANRLSSISALRSLASVARGSYPQGIVDVDPRATGARAALSLSVAPNPATESCDIRFTLPEAGPVRVGLYSVRGRQVRSKDYGWRDAGPHAIHWSWGARGGDPLPPGLYLLKCETEMNQDIRKVVVLR